MSIFLISASFGLKRLAAKWSFDSAEPMQYLLKPWGWMANCRSISNTGE